MDRPICPDCNEEMVKSYEEDEEGGWGVRWLCGCEVPEHVVSAIKDAIDNGL